MKREVEAEKDLPDTCIFFAETHYVWRVKVEKRVSGDDACQF